MAQFVVEGGYPLTGMLVPSGNKNAALPIIAATLLTTEPVTLHNVPRIRDVNSLLQIIADLGVGVARSSEHDVHIHAKDVVKTRLNRKLCREIRASILLAGPMLARYGGVNLPLPGGDVIGRRRVDTHLMALEALGAKIDVNHAYNMTTSGLHGADIFLDEASVTATENALMAAVLAKGRTIIRNAASEPHVCDLANFLNKTGARISGIGNNTYIVDGVAALGGAEHAITPDHIEIGSFIGLAAMTRGELLIKGAVPEDLRMILLVFKKLGITVEIRENGDIFVPRHERLIIQDDAHHAVPKIDDAPWPGFPTDLMSIALTIATQTHGTILFFEKMFESRLFFVDKLITMGAKIVLCDPHRAVVVGPSQLHGDTLDSPDIRAGMAILAATLCARGTSVIGNIEQIDRGYERIEEKLRALGAHIVRNIVC